MEKIVLIVHILTALAIIGLILIQQGKGAAAGASFGSGASQTVFGSEGSGSFFTRATSVFAFIFFCTSFGLAVLAKNNSTVVADIPAALESQQVQQSDIPVVDDVPASDVPVSDVPVLESTDAPAETSPAANSDIPAVPEE
jgi:preprotein translocase subunit SecG